MQCKTQLIWSGTACFNPVEKSGRRLFANLQMEEIDYPFHLSKVDYVEDIEYTLYSVNPKIWSENDDLFIEVVDRPEDPAKHYRKKK